MSRDGQVQIAEWWGGFESVFGDLDSDQEKPEVPQMLSAIYQAGAGRVALEVC